MRKAICIDASGWGSSRLTKFKEYKILWVDGDCCRFMNDNGEQSTCYITRFRMLPDSIEEAFNTAITKM